MHPTADDPTHHNAMWVRALGDPRISAAARLRSASPTRVGLPGDRRRRWEDIGLIASLRRARDRVGRLVRWTLP